MIETKAYLERINYKGSLNPSEDVLRRLHLAHLLTVPFENLSIHSNEKIILQEDLLFNKIVNCRRGGFCYELNGLFSALLNQLGFKVSKLSANVIKENGEYSADFDHMTLLVNLEEPLLADVGFGDSFRTPLKLYEREIQEQGTRAYRIYEEDNYFVLMEKRFNAGWKISYKFTLQPYEFNDFENMCNFHQTSPLSHFTQKIICSVAKPDGRVTISDNRLIITKDEVKEEKEISYTQELKVLLQQYFNIKLANFDMLINKRNNQIG